MINDLRNKLAEKGLKVTPQRLAIYGAIVKLNTHPNADKIIESIRKEHPNIATGTVYKVLDTLVENGLIKKVKTEKDVMRYDPMVESHHHLYCTSTDRIEDYIDKDLNNFLREYFQKKEIPNFNIEDIKLHIHGKFIDKN
ncbi:MAG: transcriptional repressor [Bacteroidales bacterium]|nr:transcriptional repressor [Bacteroidales bacterium]